MNKEPKTHLMVKVAKEYFENGKTQQEIANSLRISRSTISRLLTRAREEGIVQINIDVPSGFFPDLEKDLEKSCNLLEVIVIETEDFDSPIGIAKELGLAAANYLERTVHNKDVIGFAWGTTMSHMVEFTQPQKLSGIKVFQMNGGLTPQITDIHGASLTHNLATKLSGDAFMLQAPGVAKSHEAQQTFMSDIQVRQVFEMAEKASMAFFSIGHVAQNSLWGRAGLLTHDVTDELLSLNAVGDIMSRYFDKKGDLVHSSLCERVVSIPFEKLQKAERRIAAAGGIGKTEAIIGALQGGYINVLITDQITAQKIKKHFTMESS